MAAPHGIRWSGLPADKVTGAASAERDGAPTAPCDAVVRWPSLSYQTAPSNMRSCHD
jgi:hypothetical protein